MAASFTNHVSLGLLAAIVTTPNAFNIASTVASNAVQTESV